MRETSRATRNGRRARLSKRLATVCVLAVALSCAGCVKSPSVVDVPNCPIMTLAAIDVVEEILPDAPNFETWLGQTEIYCSAIREAKAEGG